jgi:hypothetical protein
MTELRTSGQSPEEIVFEGKKQVKTGPIGVLIEVSEGRGSEVVRPPPLV